jgi:hypothetical protein
MANLSTDLLDPTPPTPGPTERAAVAARAGQLVRRRRYLQGASALGVVVVIAVGVGVVATGGSGTSPGSERVQAANSGAAAAPIVTAPTAPAASTPAPDPATTTLPAPAVATEAPVPDRSAPAAPAPVTVSGHASNVPPGATLTLTLSGSGGTFTAVADASGAFSVANVPSGTYTGTWEWVSADGTASAAGRIGGLTLTSDQDVSFSV